VSEGPPKPVNGGLPAAVRPAADLPARVERRPALRQPRTDEALAAVIADGGPRALQLALRFAPATVEYDLMTRLLQLGSPFGDIANYLMLSPDDVGRLIAEPGLLQAARQGLAVRRVVVEEQALNEAGHVIRDLTRIRDDDDVSPNTRLRADELLLSVAGIATKSPAGPTAVVNVDARTPWSSPEEEDFLTRLDGIRRGTVVDTTAE